MSEAASSAPPEQGPTAISVIKDNGNKVELVIKVPQLKKCRKIFQSLIGIIKKPSDPSKLCANAKFTEYHLDNASLHFVINVYKKKKRRKQKIITPLGTYTCDIKQFPSRIAPESAEFEILQASSGNAYIGLTLIKVDNLSTNWKEFQDSNGTVDVADA
uniref:Ubiquitin-like domain-containing protein n=1 Tax=Rhabditophanes sp. KR3021 TaxID=114890 RepID=A0AC35U5B7_9BILA